MGLEQLKNELLNNARKEADKIIKNAEFQAEEIRKKSEEKLKDSREKSRENTKRVSDLIAKRAKAAAEMSVSKRYLDIRKDSLDAVFSNALLELKKLNPAKRKEHIKRLLEKAGSEVNIAFVYASPADRGFVGDRYVESDIAGGIIVENSDRTVRLDYSYEAILEQIRKDNLSEIASLLFGQGK